MKHTHTGKCNALEIYNPRPLFPKELIDRIRWSGKRNEPRLVFSSVESKQKAMRSLNRSWNNISIKRFSTIPFRVSEIRMILSK